MAEEGDSGEKTEDPTERRIKQSRDEGMVGQSADLSRLLGLVAAYVALQYIAPSIWSDMVFLTKSAFTSSYFDKQITQYDAHKELIGIIKLLLPELLALSFISAFFGAGSTALMTNFLWSWKLLRPRFSMLNPITGFGRLFSAKNFVQTLKAIAKLAVICPIAYFAFIELFPELIGLMEVPIAMQFKYTADACDYIFWQVVKFLFVISIADLMWQKWHTKEKMKMSKQEVKDERKSIEGDAATRRKIQQMGMQRLRDQMFSAIPTADVVVTNPTHIAVALKYSLERGEAPKVVAKGRGYVAERIKKIAKENGIPVLERKPLARALFKTVEVGYEIPYELYNAVAEILAYVFRLKNKNPFKNQQPRPEQG